MEVKPCAVVEAIHWRVAGIDADFLEIDHSHSVHSYLALRNFACIDFILAVVGFIFSLDMTAGVEIENRAEVETPIIFVSELNLVDERNLQTEKFQSRLAV